jgi:hypothetical protein
LFRQICEEGTVMSRSHPPFKQCSRTPHRDRLTGAVGRPGLALLNHSNELRNPGRCGVVQRLQYPLPSPLRHVFDDSKAMQRSLALAVSSLLLIVLNVSLGQHAHAQEPATSSPQSDSRPAVPTIIPFKSTDSSIGLMLKLPNVPGATSFIVHQSGIEPVQLPATQLIYVLTDELQAILDGWKDKTKVVIEPQPVSVVALQGDRELARFTTYTPCPPVAFIAARGSGQEIGKVTYGLGLGSRGYQVMRGMQRLLAANPVTLPAIAVDYPAVDVEMNRGTIPALYRESVAHGVSVAQVAILRSIEACPQTQLILFGYSQGAQVMGDAFAALSRSQRNHIKRVILFAEATYRPNDPRVRYKPKALPHHGIKGARAPFPTGETAVIESWCSGLDFVCQYNPSSRSFHGDIYNTYEVQAAEAAASALRPTMPRVPTYLEILLLTPTLPRQPTLRERLQQVPPSKR